MGNGMRRTRRTAFGLIVAATAAALVATSPALASTQNDATSFAVTGGSLAFSTVPALPALSGVTVSGGAQTSNTTMTNFAVNDATGTASGWHVSVGANTSGGSTSPVFAQYCPVVGCGTVGYVASGASLPASSLSLNTTGASLSGSGTAPTFSCNAGCAIDSTSPTTVVDAASGAGLGTWTTSGFTGTSLALSTPSTLKVLPASEVYRVDVVWTLNTGP
jgi:hypothetical protein